MSKEVENKKRESMQDLKKVVGFYRDNKLRKMLKEVQAAKNSLNTLSNSIESITTKDEERKEYKRKREEKAKSAASPGSYSDKKENEPQNSYSKQKKSSYPRTSPHKKSGTSDNIGDIVKSKPVFEEDDHSDEDRARKKFKKDKDKGKQVDDKRSGYNKKELFKKGIINEGPKSQAEINRRYKKKKKTDTKSTKKKEKVTHAVIKSDRLTVKSLSEKIGIPASELVKKLFILNIMANINSTIDFETAELVATEFDVTLEKKAEKSYEEKLKDEIEEMLKESDESLPVRSPIVTVMGHVDHGKTSLLDYIRKSKVATGEAGGITQSIGAYKAKTQKGEVTFIDTPGHSAFTEMRARGARVTDIAVLVVAADDGIMPQTVEAINHIKSAEVPMVVAINKMDKSDANPERVKQQLADHDILIEEWGGETVAVNVSAETGEGIDKLIDMILLVSEIQNIKADPDKKAIGTIIESHLDKGKGPMATVIVQNGTLKKGDAVVSGVSSGKIRALIDEKGENIDEAPPSTPVIVLGFNSVPESGDYLNVVDEKYAKQLISERQQKLRAEASASSSNTNLEDLFDKAKEGSVQDLNLVIKADSVGVVEALKQSLTKLENQEFRVKAVHQGVGAVTENDVLLAEASNSIIIAFNVRPDANAKKLSETKGVDIRFYGIIYDVIDDLKKALTGMLAPKYKEVIVGEAEVLKVFKSSKVGSIAGSMVKSGKIVRNLDARLLRDNVVIANSKIDSLKIDADDKREVKEGFECGIKLKTYDDIKQGDVIQVHEQVEIPPEEYMEDEKK